MDREIDNARRDLSIPEQCRFRQPAFKVIVQYTDEPMPKDTPRPWDPGLTQLYINIDPTKKNSNILFIEMNLYWNQFNFRL